jgi:hypothetical protein
LSLVAMTLPIVEDSSFTTIQAHAANLLPAGLKTNAKRPCYSGVAFNACS